MGLPCLLGHKWDGCKCIRCGEVRAEGHQYVPNSHCREVCETCGRVTTKVRHDWNRCQCAHCGKIRSEGHAYVKVPEECMVTCEICGTKVERHRFVDGTCLDCGQAKAKGGSRRQPMFYCFIATGMAGMAGQVIAVSHDDAVPQMLASRYSPAQGCPHRVFAADDWSYPAFGRVAEDGANIDWNKLWNAAFTHLVTKCGVPPAEAKAGLELTASHRIGTFVPLTGKVTFGVPVGMRD